MCESRPSATTLMFYSKSANAPPCKGKGECLGQGDSLANYSELLTIKNWRQVLSAFYLTEVPLEFRGRKYASREHAYHASKFPEHPEFQRLFEYDSKSVFCRDPALAKSAGGKGGVVKASKPAVKGKGLQKSIVYKRPKGVRADSDALACLPELMEAIMLAEFRQDALARRVLLATRDAVLTHFAGRSGKVVTERGLMRVRARLQQEQREQRKGAGSCHDGRMMAAQVAL